MDANSCLKLEFFSLDHKLVNLPKWRLLQDQDPYKVADSKSFIIVTVLIFFFSNKGKGGLRVFSYRVFQWLGQEGMGINRTGLEELIRVQVYPAENSQAEWQGGVCVIWGAFVLSSFPSSLSPSQKLWTPWCMFPQHLTCRWLQPFLSNSRNAILLHPSWIYLPNSKTLFFHTPNSSVCDEDACWWFGDTVLQTENQKTRKGDRLQKSNIGLPRSLQTHLCSVKLLKALPLPT